MMTIETLIERARQLYPQSRRMQNTWVKQTFKLYAEKRHALLTGGWPKGKH